MARFEPNYQNIVNAAQNKKAERIPLYEHGIDPGVMENITGKTVAYVYDSIALDDLRVRMGNFVDFWKVMGYDTVTWESGVTAVLVGGGSLAGHKPGVIKTRQDFDRYPWQNIVHRFFERWSAHYEVLREVMPENMKAIGGVGNGVFECVQDLVGFEQLCVIRYDDPTLYRDLFKAVGSALYAIWDRFLKEYADIFCVCRFGDDLGYKGGTMLAAEDISSLIIPEYARIIELVHRQNKPFLLHSCGNIFSVMDEIISTASIDSKHSNEDVIAPFSKWVEVYGTRIGNFGGIEMSVLCQNTPSEIKSYVNDVLSKVLEIKHKGLAIGSGNSIPNYIPVEGYLAMIKTVRQFRGENVN
jgi:uroporphyrinogen decarboxylase